MASGRRNPTINDIAEKAGVSKSLVSLVIRNSPHVSDERRIAVLRAAEDLQYRPNAMARSLVRQKTHVLGCVISDLHNPFFADMADGIEEAAGQAGYRTLFASGFMDPDREEKAIDTLMQLRIDGLIVAGPVAGSKFEAQAGLVPTVLLARDTSSNAVDSIANDDFQGAQLAVDHLAGLAHRRIVHIDGGRGSGAGKRRAGYESRMRWHGLPPLVIGGEYTEEGGEKAMSEILGWEKRPTAVFAPNDFAAFGALNVMDAAGLKVPEHVSLIGYDDNQFAGLGRFDLTTIRQPKFEMGERAVRLLIERLEDDQPGTTHAVLQPTLVVRSTTAPPAGS